MDSIPNRLYMSAAQTEDALDPLALQEQRHLLGYLHRGHALAV